MGNSEEAKASKSEKSSSPAVDQNSMHVYPDWAAMQAFYGPRFAVPPFMNSAVASPHAPPAYMWGPAQSMIPPYGTPYAAFYAHGGVYAHPGVPLGGTATSMETQAKSSGNTDGSFVKKLKEFDGLAISIGNGNSEGTDNGTGTDHRFSDSDVTGGSSDGSNGVAGNGKKRSAQGSPDREDGKAHKRSNLAEVDRAYEKTVDVIPPANKPVKATENMNNALLLNDPSLSAKSSPSSVPLASLPNEGWLQNERELKRERRKQSNRESARRSRLRKQAETEELSVKVQALKFENMTLKSEINKLIQSSEKLKLQNAALLEKLKDTQLEEGELAINPHKIDDLRLKPVGTINLLARVNNDVTNDEGDSYENRSSSGNKLRQLLDSRSDAVAAG